MNSKVFNYLKIKELTDPQRVNSLFVSAFIQERGWIVKHCSPIIRFLGYEQQAVTGFIEELKVNGFSFSLEDLIKLFEFVVSPSDRIVTGAVYTPANVRKVILNRCFADKNSESLMSIRVADISCGCGGFLMDAASRIHQLTGKSYAEIFKDNIFGIDIEDYAIERTKVLLCLLALSEGEDEDFRFNLLVRDSLDYADDNWDKRFNNFDIVVGNPPYVCSRNLSEQTKTKLKGYDVCSTGHPDLYIPFFKIGTEVLNCEGRLGFITMNSFLRSVNGRAVRRFFSRNRLAIDIIDFRGYQIFESRNTYTCLFFLDKQLIRDGIRYATDERGLMNDDIVYKFISYDELDDIKGWGVNEYEKTLAIESVGIQIKDYCPSRHGIATLSNDTYIFTPTDEDNQYYYHVSDGLLFPIEKGICRDVVNPNKLNSIDDLEALTKKILYPYKIEKGKAIVYDPEEMQSLFPEAYAYLGTKKKILLSRDKGRVDDYPQWYAFGRSQSLVLPRFKLFFPKFANKVVKCAICDAPNLLLYNGLAFVNNEEKKLRVLKAVVESELFWEYIKANAKPYASGYYSLSGVDINHFGLPIFTEAEENELLDLTDKSDIEVWLRDRYERSTLGEVF